MAATSEADTTADPPAERGPPDGASGADPSASFHLRRWRRHKLMAVGLGALGGGLAGLANTTYGITVALPFALVHDSLFLILLVTVIAPIVEEHVKFFALLLMQAEEKATYTPRRWMVLGLLAGIGFGIAEAALYWQSIGTVSWAAANHNLAIRALLTVPLHALAASATGYGYGLARMEGRNGPLIRGLAIAIAIHAAFNGFQTMGALG